MLKETVKPARTTQRYGRNAAPTRGCRRELNSAHVGLPLSDLIGDFRRDRPGETAGQLGCVGGKDREQSLPRGRRESLPCWWATHRMMVALTGRDLISISPRHSTWPHACAGWLSGTTTGREYEGLAVPRPARRTRTTVDNEKDSHRGQ